jgi:hypothetical protein
LAVVSAEDPSAAGVGVAAGGAVAGALAAGAGAAALIVLGVSFLHPEISNATAAAHIINLEQPFIFSLLD